MENQDTQTPSNRSVFTAKIGDVVADEDMPDVSLSVSNPSVGQIISFNRPKPLPSNPPVFVDMNPVVFERVEDGWKRTQ